MTELTPHPVLVAPTVEEIRALTERHGAEKVAELLSLREDKILAERLDPYRHGFELPHWRDADKLLVENREILVLGGNRASKTEWAAKRVVQALCSTPDARVWCLHTTNQSSIQMQQNVIFKYLPSEFKDLKKNRITNVQYTQKNGFSDNTFILPNKAQCFFMNYAQKRDVIEGGEVDLIWCDELVPLDWVETLRYRTVTRNGKLIITFTPVTGYSPVVKEFVSTSKFVETRPSSLLSEIVNVPNCPKGHMPYVAKSLVRDSAIMWFHSELNPYNPFDSLKKTLAGKKSHEIKIRAYGWADNVSTSQLNVTDASIVPPDSIPEDGTNYMVVDPAGARNWFMLWFRITPDNKIWLYREWPDSTEGEWALPDSSPDGRPGTAQRAGSGKSLLDYKRLILNLEDGEEIAERIIDPRAGGTKAVSDDGGVTLIELLDSGEEPMHFVPSAGVRIEQGISILNDWLAYDVQQPVSKENSPRLMVSSDCTNVLWCMREWTGGDGEKGASKDPVDCLRYLAVMDPSYQGADAMRSFGGGSY